MGLYRPSALQRACCAALLGATLVVACSPVPRPSAQSSLKSSSLPSSEPEPSSMGDTPPPLTATESRIIESLGALGIAAMPAEHGFGKSAAIWSRIDADRALYVYANPVGTDGAEFSVITQRDIEGVTVERVEYASGPVRDRFPCDDLVFETEGAVPPGFDDFDIFLGRFIVVLDCPPAP